jgi:hypothetical protein
MIGKTVRMIECRLSKSVYMDVEALCILAGTSIRGCVVAQLRRIYSAISHKQWLGFILSLQVLKENVSLSATVVDRRTCSRVFQRSD